MHARPIDAATTLEAAGLSRGEAEAWLASIPDFGGMDLEPATPRATGCFAAGEALLGRLPARARRTQAEERAADVIKDLLRTTRTAFLRAHVGEVYAALTGGMRRFVRVEDLVYAAAEQFPGLTPTRAAVRREREHLQRDKEGLEIDQGLFLSQVLARAVEGGHLVHAMLRPRPEAEECLAEFAARGEAAFGQVRLRREGPAVHLELTNPRFLNAEDDSTTDDVEAAVDLAILDPASEVVVVRGSTVEHPRYAGRRVFSAGINLTHLYHGQISFLFYLTRDLGFVNKIYRGLSGPEFLPGEAESTIEKPFVAAVEAFAIGGGCQLLLVMDHVLAEEGAYFNLPARKEGIIPGAANLRFTRFLGDRLARQGILMGRDFPADSAEGRLLCDEVVPRGQMDEAIARTVATLTGAGVVSAAANRKALRVGQEPIEQFRSYMSLYAREQAYCHFSPALIRNLEQNWNAHQRKP